MMVVSELIKKLCEVPEDALGLDVNGVYAFTRNIEGRATERDRPRGLSTRREKFLKAGGEVFSHWFGEF